jgi:(E)-4-hydroxy-3-methylbut-2-enyl-diphosphate synthase
VFIDGKKAATLRGATLSADFKQMVIDYIERRWGQTARAAEPAEAAKEYSPLA